MRDGQEAIYYIAGDDTDALAQSPQLEGFKAKGIEVLLLTDPIDEFWVPSVDQFKEKPFKSVTRGGADLSSIAAGADEPAPGDQPAPDGLNALIARFKLVLQDQIKDVRTSERLTDSPVCLVADEGDVDMHLERLLRQHRQLDAASKRILEINPRHPLVQRLAAVASTPSAEQEDAARVDDLAHLLLDQARILEGEQLPDPAGFSRRLAAALARAA